MKTLSIAILFTIMTILVINKDAPNPDDIPEHQQYNKDKKLDIKIPEEKEASPDDWNYVDQGRNWGWECSKGYNQSPVNIGSRVMKDQEPDARTTIRYGFAKPTPKLKITVNAKAFTIEAEGDNGLGSTVVHPPQDPESALSFILKKVHIKTPSEHTIQLQHSPLELQFEHDLDFKKSYIRPQEAGHVPSKLFVAVLVDPGMKNAFLDKILDKIPKDEEFKTWVPKEGDDGKIEVDESIEEGKHPLMYVLGDSFVPEQALEMD